jgi:hypothetical protein
MAAANVVQANHEKSVGINGLTRAYTLIPPAGFLVIRAVIARCVVMAAQCVAYQYRIGVLVVELAIGFVNQVISG